MVEQDETRHRVSGAPQKATKETSSVIRLPRERLGEAPVWSLAASTPDRTSWTSSRKREPAPMRSLTCSPAAFFLSPGVLPSRRVRGRRDGNSGFFDDGEPQMVHNHAGIRYHVDAATGGGGQRISES